jgi:SAM-dependent methyltransferase
MKHPCGCINEVDEESGVTHCVKKCDEHITWALTHSNDRLEHYAEMGCLSNGIPQNKRLIEELKIAFTSIGEYFDFPKLLPRILEIGCGLGMYVPFFLARGWIYTAIEPAKVAAYWTENTFNVRVINKRFEDWSDVESLYAYDAVLGAHVFEHFEDTRRELLMAWGALKNGGKLYIIVPDDTDQTNPDHWWFFTQDTLRALLEKIGFGNIRMTQRKVVEREDFIYCVAEKP